MTHYIYIFRNILNNKIYIGQTVNPTRRKNQHKYDCFSRLAPGKLYSSMRKYGINNFEFIVFAEYSSDIIDEAEIFWIEYLQSRDECRGYNIELGGNLSKKIVSDETREKHRKNMLGRRQTEETKLKISQAKIGMKHTSETRKKWSEQRKGKKRSAATCAAISRGRKGISVIPTTETRKKMSEQSKGENNSRAKLKENDVLLIINKIKNNIKDNEIALEFNVSSITIGKIRLGYAWKHISRI
jgi:group I intron endonuclease